MLRNESVVYAWTNGERAASGHMSTDGVDLFSYSLKIASRADSETRIWDYTARGKYVSQTTSCHVGLALRIAGSYALLIQPQD